ncbi:MAG: formylglycine-generating enzyme family protein [Kiritimatiellae bacterium]|nr:formylglycine-generating enzyme family protein [Kiritimatiellia bacterium]
MGMKRMMMAAATAAILGTGFVPSAYAAVSVTGVKAVQRYPWNGLVDIDYTVVCDDATADVYVFPEGTDDDTGARLQIRTLTGEGANGAVKAGTHRMTWNAANDMPNYHTPKFSVKMTAIRGGAPFIVIDLSRGADAFNYPVRFSTIGPDLTNDICRTTELWLRIILPGTFTMGSPETELGRQSNETQHSVTITKPFYMGLFEVTQKQYTLIMGSNPSSYKGDTRPVERVSYNGLRGSSLGANWPSHNQVDADSFFGKLRARTALTFDLPTEAQWEYACRAGTTAALNNGKDLSDPTQCAEMAEVGRYSNNRSDGKGGYSPHTKVGSYAPNAWGLYDMHGNVWEWCLDWFGNYATEAQTDPAGAASGSYRVRRGGSWCNGAQYCRSAYRSRSLPSSSYINYGFRLCCSAGLQ